MELKARSLLSAALAVLLCSCVPENRLPDPKPPFLAESGAPVEPELKVMSVNPYGQPACDQPSLWMGNKRIGFREGQGANSRDQMAEIMVDGHEALAFHFWGSTPDEGNFGYPFKLKEGTKPSLTYDQAAKYITYSKEYLQANGASATFSYTLKAVGPSQVEVSWDLGVPQDKFAADTQAYCGVSPWFMATNAYREEGLKINGKMVKFKDKELLEQGKGNPVASGEGGFELVFAPDKPLRRFAIKMPGYYGYGVEESRNGDSASLVARVGSGKRLAADKFLIDFGDVATQAADAPPPVAGIDFWGQDRFCVPAPTTKNLAKNPSFEQGLRYWKWWGGGGKYNPSEIPAYSLSPDAKFGKSALWIRPGKGAMSLNSFVIPVVKGKEYTVSVYAKAEEPNGGFHLGVMGVKGSKFSWMDGFKNHQLKSTDWERKSFTFTADCAGVGLMLGSGKNVLIDGLQVEEGPVATDFAAPAVEGFLSTSDPDNNLALGQDVNAALSLQGEPGAKGKVHLQLFNYYREKLGDLALDFVLDSTGSAKLASPYEKDSLGTGVFVVQADYALADGGSFRDYYRLSIMDFLENKHADKDVFGSLCHAPRITRGDDLMRNYMRWGFGSTTYGWQTKEEYELFAKYHISNFLMIACDAYDKADRDFVANTKKWTEITPEIEKRVEEISYQVVKAHPWGTSWAWSTESEGSPIIAAGKFDEWAKVQLACWRGVKRANPDALVLPDGGTSGFSRLRGYREMEGYLKADQGKVKWDAMAVHPYGAVDGIDECTDMLNEIMAKYGYGKSTPIDYTEGYNCTNTKIPEWGDDGCYDNYQGGKPSYDFGWREFLQAAHVARVYLACLKGWPQVRSFNAWISQPFMDLYLTPYAVCKAPNTLGHLLPKPVFKADVLPAEGVKGYVFEDELGRGVAAVWANGATVQEGLAKGPVMSVAFQGDIPEFIDLMGNVRKAVVKDGVVDIPLSPAPLFLRSAPGGADKLAAVLNAASVSGSGSSLKVAIDPALDGSIDATMRNLTGKELKGELVAGGNAIPFDIKAKGELKAKLKERVRPVPGDLYPWSGELVAKFADGRLDRSDWDMRFFYAPHVAAPLPLDPASPAWDKIPAIAMTNFFGSQAPGKDKVKENGPDDLRARFQVAWDDKNLYVRVSGVDDHFVVTEPERYQESVGRVAKTLYMHDACVELYLDCGANGRVNQIKDYDQDDYRYDIAPGNDKAASGPGIVYRLYEPYHQLAGGLEMPKKDEAAKGVKCQFQRDGGNYAYVMVLPQRYIEPVKLEKGWLAGFGLYIHDKDALEEQWPTKGKSLATTPGLHCDHRPNLWPIMVLAE